MKNVLVIILLFAISLPCFAELTENDIRRIIREEIEPLKIEIATIKGDIKVMNSGFDAIDEKMSLFQWFIGGLVAIIVFAIGLPLLLMTYRERKENRLSKEIDELKQEIAALKKKKGL